MRLTLPKLASTVFAFMSLSVTALAQINPNTINPGTYQNGTYTYPPPGTLNADTLNANTLNATTLTATTSNQKGPVCNVMTYGAAGTGLVDDTAAVQAAITACTAASGSDPTVFFPAGFYAVHGLQVSSTNMILEGSGGTNTELLYNGVQNTGTYPNVVPSSNAYIVNFAAGLSTGGVINMELVGYNSKLTVNSVATDGIVINGQVDSQSLFYGLGFSTFINHAIHDIKLAPALLAAGTSGYSSATGVATTGGTGSGMTVNITASGGTVTGVTITSLGTGYTTGASGYLPGDVVTITQAGSSNDSTFTLGALTTFTNMFMHQVRFDYVAGCGVDFDGLFVSSGQPFSLDGFTYTINGIGESTWLTSAGYIPSFSPGVTPWGRGVVCLTGGRDYQFALSNGRMEMAQPRKSPAGKEADLFNELDPLQPTITLDTSGNPKVTAGGYGWMSGFFTTTYTGCSVAPNNTWTISNGAFTAGSGGGGTFSMGATVSFTPHNTSNYFSPLNVIGSQLTGFQVPEIYSASGNDGYFSKNVQVSPTLGMFMNGTTGAISDVGSSTADEKQTALDVLTTFGWSSTNHVFMNMPSSGISTQSKLYGPAIFSITITRIINLLRGVRLVLPEPSRIHPHRVIRG